MDVVSAGVCVSGNNNNNSMTCSPYIQHTCFYIIHMEHRARGTHTHTRAACTPQQSWMDVGTDASNKVVRMQILNLIPRNHIELSCVSVAYPRVLAIRVCERACSSAKHMVYCGNIN